MRILLSRDKSAEEIALINVLLQRVLCFNNVIDFTTIGQVEIFAKNKPLIGECELITN